MFTVKSWNQRMVKHSTRQRSESLVISLLKAFYVTNQHGLRELRFENGTTRQDNLNYGE